MKIYNSTRQSGESTPEDVLDSKTRKASGSLLDRLITDEEDLDTPSYHYSIDGVIRSIKRNLDRALNVHAAGSPANLELGIPDFNHSTVSTLEVSKQLVESVRKCIVMAEPRLKDVEVRSKSDPNSPLDLDFTITASLRVESAEEQIRIEIAMKDGHFYPS
ncbi:type VI secretion system baseplate subunit TssE [Bartonella sp. LJL80]